MEEELARASAIYDLIVTFLVNYSFQILGAILIFVAGIVIASKISNGLFTFCQSKGLDVTLSKFIANVVKLLFILMIGIIALGNLGDQCDAFCGGNWRLISGGRFSAAGAAVQLWSGTQYHPDPALCGGRHGSRARSERHRSGHHAVYHYLGR